MKKVGNFTFDADKPDRKNVHNFAFDKLFEALSGSTNLRSAQLSLQGEDQERDILHLRNLPNLNFLFIKGTTWSKEKIAGLCAFPALHKLVLHSRDLDPKLLAGFQKSNSLEEITVEFSLESDGKYRSQVLHNAKGKAIKIIEEEKNADWEEEEKDFQKEHPNSLKTRF